jgi:hypothetical protein
MSLILKRLLMRLQMGMSDGQTLQPVNVHKTPSLMMIAYETAAVPCPQSKYRGGM